MSPTSSPNIFMSTTSLPPPMSLLVDEMLRVLSSTTLRVTGIKPSATTVDLSSDSNIDFLSTSIEKRFSLGNNILYSGNVPSSFLTDV